MLEFNITEIEQVVDEEINLFINYPVMKSAEEVLQILHRIRGGMRKMYYNKLDMLMAQLKKQQQEAEKDVENDRIKK